MDAIEKAIAILQVLRSENEAVRQWIEEINLDALDDEGNALLHERVKQETARAVVRTNALLTFRTAVEDMKRNFAAAWQSGPKLMAFPAEEYHAALNMQNSPRLGELIICLFTSPDRQIDRLADFAELFQTEWLPRFGPRVARWVYVAQALQSAAAVVRIDVIANVVDCIVRALRQ